MGNIGRGRGSGLILASRSSSKGEGGRELTGAGELLSSATHKQLASGTFKCHTQARVQQGIGWLDLERHSCFQQLDLECHSRI